MAHETRLCRPALVAGWEGGQSIGRVTCGALIAPFEGMCYHSWPPRYGLMTSLAGLIASALMSSRNRPYDEGAVAGQAIISALGDMWYIRSYGR